MFWKQETIFNIADLIEISVARTLNYILCRCRILSFSFYCLVTTPPFVLQMSSIIIFMKIARLLSCMLLHLRRRTFKLLFSRPWISYVGQRDEKYCKMSETYGNASRWIFFWFRKDLKMEPYFIQFLVEALSRKVQVNEFFFNPNFTSNSCIYCTLKENCLLTALQAHNKPCQLL